MKLNILSDLHQSRGALAVPRNDADVVILAGDIARPKDAVSWALGLNKPVLYVPGNHEFYGTSIADATDELKKLCASTHIHILDNDQVVIDGVRFLGTTLWTDFMLCPDGEERKLAMLEAHRFMRDFSVIHVDEPMPRLFTPDDAVALCRIDTQWLEDRLAEPHAGPTVVITHHAPSRHSVHPRFAGSALNGCFVSDLHHLVDGQRVQLWVHGHTHDSFDYMLNGTRVVCNPRGYAKGRVNENPLFDSNFVVQIGPSAKSAEQEQGMPTWFSKQLGDGVLSYESKDQIQTMFPALFAAAGEPVDMAVFTQHELEGRLQCEVVAYFSPRAQTLARQLGAKACERPFPTDLDLLAGVPGCWFALFPERQKP